jgi:hypothetical protein
MPAASAPPRTPPTACLNCVPMLLLKFGLEGLPLFFQFFFPCLTARSDGQEQAAASAPPQWLNKNEIESKVGRLYDDEYTELCDLFTRLWMHPRGGERIRKVISPFLRFAVGAEHLPPRGKVRC